MNLVRNSFRRFATGQGKYLVEQLTNRDIIRVSGEDVAPFLQGLITNDMKHFEQPSHHSLYAMFLNKNGRVMYDSIIFRTTEPHTFLIECDKDVSEELRRHLRLFRVRRKIDIDSIGSDHASWALFDYEHNRADLKLATESAETVASVDPRLKALGYRLVLPKEKNVSDIKTLVAGGTEIVCSTDGDNDYTLHRYKLGVGEGVCDHPPTKCFPLEVNCDYLYGVSFHKGCYIGQELTARTYHTGTIRKRLMPLTLAKELGDSNQPFDTVLTTNGSNVGAVRGIKGKMGLAVIRIEPALKADSLFVGKEKVEIFKPFWWPEASKKISDT